MAWRLFLQSAQRARRSVFKERCTQKISFFFARTRGAAFRLSAFTGRQVSPPALSHVILPSNHLSPTKERNDSQSIYQAEPNLVSSIYECNAVLS